jgi:hypothetical protein
MISQLDLKRVCCVIGVMSAAVVLIIGLVAHDAAPSTNWQNKFLAAKNAQYIACASSAAHGDHPKPWLKIVVSHVISVATRLAI